ncbi:cytochrome c [Flavobacterium psychrophilum]|uniref:c-type cytochrome n=1 Tax=Flavobacterium psychrophilum TaxID=96345 RepID=UPI0004F7C4B6|nr:cytochrome c [Flavobacterium psychrophilum]AIN73284.1 cytochrome C [Flavobacterium psychrophilum FPG3]EKT2069633.1 cytochrome c [Flavobacterium psychrophilum]EKT2071893.1 cytochrome c [Flavobacterium psychrophilum]EKT4491415.1 cytochrome c [Flavobacterium psychrophilum]MBF2043867.1 cytochrome c [Flavobacterium psychrophilum]
MKKVYTLAVLMGMSSLLFSCQDKLKPNYQFFPNMYESAGYETYSESSAFKNGKEGQLPVQGTVKRGFVPYEIPNTPEGYLASKKINTTPLYSTKVDSDKGKVLFDIYCAICHGEKGDGKGNLVKREKYLGVPSYADREVSVGSIYHVETYGLNSMGSYANQLSQTERWQVAAYVLKLKSEL